jgi:hypothetical protein
VRTVLLALLVAAAASCGGEQPLSKKEYAARLSAACDAFAAREEKIGDPRTLFDLVGKGPLILSARRCTWRNPAAPLLLLVELVLSQLS